MYLILLLLLLQSVQCMSMNYTLVMAAGDSITAALGARWSYIRPKLFVYEDCGVSFATGGDDDTVSIAKLIEKEYGHVVEGKSYGSRRVKLCIDRPANRVFCPRDPIRIRRRDDGYNVALTGATSEALPLQFEELKKRYEEDEYENINRMLLTLLIGANDLCMWDCRRPEQQLESFQNNTLNFIHNVKKYFGQQLDVLIAEIPALEGIPVRAKGTGMEGFAVIECPCAYYLNDGYSFASRINLYNQFLRSLKQQEDVMITDSLRKEELKDWPREMTSKLDAFHPSKWAQEYFAVKIYNELEGL